MDVQEAIDDEAKYVKRFYVNERVTCVLL